MPPLSTRFMQHFCDRSVISRCSRHTFPRRITSKYATIANNTAILETKENVFMSTTTPGPHKTEAEEGTVASTAGRTLHSSVLILMVFVAGACSLAIELSASRLLAPFFGTSLFVWANLIGLILLYLTIGYYVGGRLADRFPRPKVLYTLTTVAAFLIGIIPLISRPILSWSLTSFANFSISIFYGSLVSVLLLFA